ncbi:phosphatase PAP2 family protein [Streptomyces sp. SCSIO 30461]|uniref:bifunctional phosphatase PAP2/diacylglycerol kinase family protein n=1 Tax=Streptomyces sp. SCSIO 30461 TaxID=3118085 RepID=UPI0030CAE1CF
MNTLRVGRIRQRLHARDAALFGRVASRRWPGAEPVLPRLSTSANHGLLWFGIGAGIWALGGVRGRRAAVRGVASLALASGTVNTLAKGAVRRARPLLDDVPIIRHLPNQPVTSSFPSGHAASAAAFATGVAMESRGWGAAIAPVAASVAFSRVYTGVHFPSDVLVGTALGVGAAYAVRGIVPSRSQLPAPARPRADAPALPEGKGLTVVVNPSSGAQPQLIDPVRQLQTALPQARVVVYDPEAGALPDVLAEAAKAAAESGGALGVCGGDGTVNAAAACALRFDVPLAVLPGGTFNHFAADLGADTIAVACAAVEAGSAVRADVGRIRVLAGAEAGRGAEERRPNRPDANEPRYFLNTFSIGVYPELVRVREHWSPRVGGPAAALIAVLQVLRTARPLRAKVNGRARSVWLLFAGNGAYQSFGMAPTRRHDLSDGLFDVRIAHGGRCARTRLLATAVAGGLARTRLYASARPRRLVISGLPDGTSMAFDGEVVPAPSSLLLDKLDEALTVYRPVVD